MVDDSLYGICADVSVPDCLVAVLVAAEWVLAVVQVHSLESVYANHLVEFLKHIVKRVYNVVAGVVHVASVEAHAEFVVQVHLVYYRAQFLECSAHFAAFACHGFEQHGGCQLGREHGVESLGYEVDGYLRSLLHMASGVEVVHIAWHHLHALDVVGERLTGEGAYLWSCGAEVQRVWRVGEYYVYAVFFREFLKSLHVSWVDRLGLSAARVTCEELECVGSD